MHLKMNEICVISDCHLGYRHRLKHQRLIDYENAFKDAIEKAMRFNPILVIFLGDLFHYPKPDARTLHLAIKTIRKIAEKCKVILCIGNHEIEGSLDTTYLNFFSEIHSNIYVLNSTTPHINFLINEKKFSIHGFEYTRNKENAEKILEKISSEISSKGKDIVNILCLHQALQNYLEPHEISLQIIKIFAKKFDLILLGHLHKHKKIEEISDVPAFYVGSTERISFNESENKNGFLVFHDLNFSSPEFIEVRSAKMRVIKEYYDEEKTPEEINERIKKLIEENSDVKCLQIDIDVKIKGDIFEIKRDWQTIYKNFTILDVNIIPKTDKAKEVTIERIELSAELIEEYFEKSGLKDEGELKKVCLELYEKYGK